MIVYMLYIVIITSRVLDDSYTHQTFSGGGWQQWGYSWLSWLLKCHWLASARSGLGYCYYYYYLPLCDCMAGARWAPRVILVRSGAGGCQHSLSVPSAGSVPGSACPATGLSVWSTVLRSGIPSQHREICNHTYSNFKIYFGKLLNRWLM